MAAVPPSAVRLRSTFGRALNNGNVAVLERFAEGEAAAASINCRVQNPVNLETLSVDRYGMSRYNGAMAESALRRRKKQAQNARWRRLRPAERMRRMAELTAAGSVLRAAGLARLGLSANDISRIERSRDS